MSEVSDNSRSNELDVLKRQLPNTVNEVLQHRDDPHSIEELVRMLGLIMNNVKDDRRVTNRVISSVCSMLSNSVEEVTLGLGEGRTTAKALLVAAKSLIGEPVEMIYSSDALMRWDMEEFQSFYENLPIQAPVARVTIDLIQQLSESDNQPIIEESMPDFEDERSSSPSNGPQS